VDTVSPQRRSEIMARIRSKDTKPELEVRRELHRRGLRYSLHSRTLPGSPDLVFRSRRTVLFIHGCFWHGCPHCAVGRRRVKSNTDYWEAKLERNRARDARHRTVLEAAGWRVLWIWECESRSQERIAELAEEIRAWVSSPRRPNLLRGD
jgi:DNA mismatch endonuclease (patch repair protein)